MRLPSIHALGALALSISLVTMPAARALAQDEGDAAEKTPEKPAEEAKPAAPAAPIPKNGFARVSDDQETIYAVQRKAYLVYKKFELTPMIAASFADRYVETYAPAASATYHLAENFGLELF